MSISISRGAIAKFMNMNSEGAGDETFQPLLEVLEVKKITDGSTNAKLDRCHLMISDGIDQMKAILSTQLSEKVQNGEITTGCVIKILAFMVNAMPFGGESPMKKVVIILGVETVATSIHQITPKVETANRQGMDPRLNTPTPYGVGAVPSTTITPPSLNPYGQSHGQNYPLPYNQSIPSQPYGHVESAYRSTTNPPPGGSMGGYSGLANSRPVVREGGDLAVIPIHALNPYTAKWTIKARVTSKSDIRKFTNAKGEGCLFSIDLLDAAGGEVRGTFFGSACVEKFYQLLSLNQVFFFSGGRLKLTNKKFCQLKNEYEITFDERSEIRSAPEDTTISRMNYDFIKLADLAGKSKDDTIDVLGFVKSATDVTALFSSKLGKDIYKRELQVMDDSLTECRVTLWGDKAQQTDNNWESHPIVAFKRMAVDDYNGRCLKTASSSTFEVNPDLPAARELYNWAQSTCGGDLTRVQTSTLAGAGGGGSRDTSLASRTTIAHVRDSGLGHSEKGDYFCVKAWLLYAKSDNPWYNACKNCKKKMSEQMNRFVCDKCNTDTDQANLRYILNASLADESGSFYFTLFDDQAALVLGKSADELNALGISDRAAYDDVFAKATFRPYILSARAKYELVKDEQRLKFTVNAATPLDFAAESSQLLAAIHKYELM